MGSLARFAFLLVIAGAFSGCRDRSPGPSEGEEVFFSRLDVAAKEWPGVLLELGTPAALPWLDEGWSYGEVGADGNPMRWAIAERAGFRFESDREGLFLAWLECEPFQFERSPTQFVGLTVNGVEQPAIELRPGRERYPVEIPVARGVNRVEMRFRYAGEPTRTSADRRRLAVAFYRFDVRLDGEPPVSGQPGPFARLEAGDGARGFFLPAGAKVSIHRGDAEASRLRLVLGAEAPIGLRAPTGARLAVSVASEKGEVLRELVEAEEARSVWERELAPIAGRHRVTLEARGPGLFVQAELFEPPLEPREETEESLPSFPEPENVVVVVLDGANALRTGLYGYEKETTPVLDALGRESVVFDVAVAQAVYTIASIGSFLTGQYPERHQNVTFADRLREDVVTLPALLGEAGFRTAAFSGNAVVSSTFGLDRGYDEHFPAWKQHDYTGHGDSVLRGFRTWLDGAPPDERFFAYVHFREPHFPYNPPPPYDARFGPESPFPEGLADADLVESLNDAVASGEPLDDGVRARVEGLYDGNLAYVDALVGEIVEELRTREVLDDTVLVIAADHGEALFEHGFLGHNVQLYEESIRIPLLLRIPGVEPRRVPDVVELLDLTPTLLHIASVDAPQALEAMQGRSLLPLALGRAGASRPAELAFSRTVWEKPRYAARGERYKLIWDSRTGTSELYDLHEDPAETENLAGLRPLVEGHLRQSLFDWYREQERLRAGEPPPAESAMTEDERRTFDSLGYAHQVNRKKQKP